MVKVTFARKCTFTDDVTRAVRVFTAGVRDVEERVADHWFVKAHLEGAAPPPPAPGSSEAARLAKEAADADAKKAEEEAALMAQLEAEEAGRREEALKAKTAEAIKQQADAAEEAAKPEGERKKAAADNDAKKGDRAREMTVTVASFLEDYPVFNSASFSQTQIQRYLTLAQNTLDCRRWGDYLDLGTELFAAHNLSMDAMAQNGANGGGVPGQISGPATSKAVDKVSVGYDVSLAKLEDAGAYNLTSYGVRYWQLVQMIGLGGMQL